ncbi:MAG TPA: CAAX prenyl protease-related protein [Tepidisphaeraceae bacterium]|nr:CAAX prenyl protease-related protein [Tepidisphaeraceae bacterium]
MTNDESITNDPNSNDETAAGAARVFRHSVFGHSSLIRHSSFVIRVSPLRPAGSETEIPPPDEKAEKEKLPPRRISPELAYILPMAVFLVLTWAGGQWPALYVASYVSKTLITPLLLIVLWPNYTKIRWTYWWLGAVMGVIGVFQWIGMEKGLIHLWPNFPEMHAEVFDPTKAFSSSAAFWSFVAVRWAGASLVVPVMEELFWRDFLWRTVAAPADFLAAAIGQWDRGVPLLAVSAAFCLVHPFWLTAFVWGIMIGLLLALTRSLGACIVMHAVTNFLLGAYVLWFHDWRFW